MFGLQDLASNGMQLDVVIQFIGHLPTADILIFCLPRASQHAEKQPETKRRLLGCGRVATVEQAHGAATLCAVELVIYTSAAPIQAGSSEWSLFG